MFPVMPAEIISKLSYLEAISRLFPGKSGGSFLRLGACPKMSNASRVEIELKV